MSVPPESQSRRLAVPWPRLGAFVAAGLAAGYLGFVCFTPEESRQILRQAGYYLILATFSLWLWSLWRARDLDQAEAGEQMARADWLLAIGAIGLMTGLALAHETFRSKILYDEYVLQSTAYNLHYFRDNSAMVRGYELQGIFLSTDSYVDKRPVFFSFLLATVHDLSGFRTQNVFWLNAALCAGALGLVWRLGWRLNRRLGGLLAVVLLGSLPLFAQNATGAGMELLNLAMLLVAVHAARAWLERPDETRLSVFVLSMVLFCQSRYESSAYVLPAALAIALGWWRARRIVLSWSAVAAPLLLVPVALLQKMISGSPVMWELKQNQTTRFSVEYLAENLSGAWGFFSSTGIAHGNSLLLGSLGLAALGWIGWRLVRNGWRPGFLNPDRWALLLFGGGILGVTTLIMFYYWAALNDPMASRFALPFHLLLVLAVVVAAASLDRRWPVSRVVLVLAGLFTLGSAVPKQAYHFYSHLGNDELEWELRFVAARPAGTRLIVSNKSTLPWLIEKTPAILLERSRAVADRLALQLGMPDFQEILVTQSLRPTTREGDYEIEPGDALPEWFRTEPLAERRFGTKLARISRLVAVDLPPDFKPSTPPPMVSGEAGAGRSPN
jgi:hypothetical protein